MFRKSLCVNLNMDKNVLNFGSQGNPKGCEKNFSPKRLIALKSSNDKPSNWCFH